MALVRKGFELDERVREEGERMGLKAEVKLWEQAWQIDEWVRICYHGAELMLMVHPRYFQDF